MTTQIHECHPRDTKEQSYDVRLHDVELHDVANTCFANVCHVKKIVRKYLITWCCVLRGRQSNVAAAIPGLLSPRAKHL